MLDLSSEGWCAGPMPSRYIFSRMTRYVVAIVISVPVAISFAGSSVAFACNNNSSLVAGRQIMVRNNYGTAPINISGNRNSLSLPTSPAPSSCPDGRYRISTVFVDIGGSAFNASNVNFIELGIRYYKAGGTTSVKIFVEVADHWDRAGSGLSATEWDPSYFGCTISPGSSTQPKLQIQKVPAAPGNYWQPAIDCGAGMQNAPKTLTSTTATAFALGETEIYGYPTSSSPLVYAWPSMTDSHISNGFIAPGNNYYQPWGSYRCYSQAGAPPWKPVQAYGGYSLVSGGSACNSNF